MTADITTIPEQGRISRAGLLRRAESSALLVLALALCVFFSLWSKTSDTFFSVANLQAVLGNQALLGVATLAILIPFICNQYDLSVGASLGLASIVAANGLVHGMPVIAVMGLGLATAIAVAIFNALVVTRLGVDAVVTTLGTSIVIAGVVTWVSSGQAVIPPLTSAMVTLGTGNTASLPNAFLLLAVLAVVVWYVLEQTPFGRKLYALGSNQEAAQLLGMNTRRLVLASFLIGGVLSGLAGLLLVVRTGAASPQIGATFTLPAFAAAFLSAASIRPGRFNVWGAMVAIFFLAVLNSGLNIAGVPSYASDIVNGAALIVGVALAALVGRARRGASA